MRRQGQGASSSGRHAGHLASPSTGASVAPSPYSRSSAGDYHARLRKKRRRSLALRAFLVTVVVLLAGSGVAFAAWLGGVQGKMNDSQVVTEELRQALTERDAPNDPYYVLLLGTDGRPGETQYRSDTIILARIDPQQKIATLLSIPRDTMVTWKGSTMKINGAHTYDGAAGMVQIVSDLCHVEISHYVEVNFDGLSGITDALGGVTVAVDMDMRDTEHFDDVTELSKGEQVLNGAQALFYCRCRYFADGDYTRMRHQRTFVKSLIAQVLTTTDPTKLLGVVNSCADMIITDMSVTDIAGLANEMRGMDTQEGIYTAFVPSAPQNVDGVSYVVADWDTLDEMMKVIDAGEDPSGFNDGGYGNSSSE